MAMETDTNHAATVFENLPLPSQLENLSKLIGEKPEALATGSEGLRKAALHATKFIYDLGMSGIALIAVFFLQRSVKL